MAVLGLGYVGCVSAACLARLGHSVVGVDRDEHKVGAVLEGRAPFYEPGLQDLVQQGRETSRLSASTSLADGVANADIILICVGTPSESNGNLGLTQLERVVGELGDVLKSRSGERPVVAIRSTVFPGTCEEVVMPRLEGTAATVVSHPEFLREGTAVRDFMEPSLLVVGGDDRAACERVASLYQGLPVEASICSLRTAELIKYACNAYHAVKVAFANEVGTLGARLGIDGREVMDVLCRDVKLNVSAAYLKPGFAFGGSCLPKDLRALNFRASRMDLDLPLLKSVLPSNEQHLQRAVQAVLGLPGRRLGVFGLTFKEDTDDLRESPTVALLEQLIGKGRDVRVFDPHLKLESIYGSNKNFLLAALPHISRLMEPTLEGMLGWADAIVITQKPSAALVAPLNAVRVPVLDLTRLMPEIQHQMVNS